MVFKKLFALILIFNLIFLFSCSDSVSNTNEQITAESQFVWEGVPEVDNITYKYIDNTALKFDMYFPTVKKFDKSPVVVCFHGGGWNMGDKEQIMNLFEPIISKLRANGYTVASVEYRLATDSTYFPAPIEDCIDSILYLKNNAAQFNINTDSIGVFGYSAGAHLAMLSAYAMDVFSVSGDTADIKYCVSFAGPTKLYDDDVNKYSYDILSLLDNLFHGTYAEKPDEYKIGSPYYYVDGITDKTKKVPLLLAQDENDAVVPFEQSQVMYDKAKEIGIPCELLKLHGVGHDIYFDSNYSYMTSPSSDEAADTVVDFICKYSGKQ